MSELLINDELATFITSGISITVASRSIDNIPSAARAKGCVLSRDGQCRMRIFVASSQARQVVADIKTTGAISVTFSDPPSHRTVQLKGFDAHVRDLQPSERILLEDYLKMFCARVEPFGFSTAYIRAFFASPADEVALEFSPSEAYQQTPGPNAGARL